MGRQGGAGGKKPGCSQELRPPWCPPCPSHQSLAWNVAEEHKVVGSGGPGRRDSGLTVVWVLAVGSGLESGPLGSQQVEEDAKNMEERQGHGAGDAYVRGNEETCFVDDPTGLGSWVQPGLPP